MKVLLIKPKTNLFNRSPPNSFVALAGQLRHHNVKILDAQCYQFDEEYVIDYVKEEKPDVIGFGGQSNEIAFSYTLAEEIRKFSKAKIIFGGSHATGQRNEVLSKPFIDFIFMSEAEVPFAEFIDKLEAGEDYKKVSNLGYKDKGKLVFNEIGLCDFNSLEMPNWDLIKLKDYRKASTNKKFPSAPIFTTRGCPFRCTYCAGFIMSGRRFRMRDVEKVIEEIKYLKATQGIKEFQIWDDNFTLIKQRVMKFCDLLMKEDLGLIWGANGVRIDKLDEEVIIKMKEAGCWIINLPFEFGTQRILDLVKKGSNLEKMKEIAPLVEKHGIKATLLFMMGHPEETIEEIEETIKLSLEIPASRVFFSPYTLLPGTEDYAKYKNNAKYQHLWGEGDEEIKKLWRKAIFKFYFRPRQFFILIKDNVFNYQQLTEFLTKFKLIFLK